MHELGRLPTTLEHVTELRAMRLRSKMPSSPNYKDEARVTTLKIVAEAARNETLRNHNRLHSGQPAHEASSIRTRRAG